MGCNVETGAKIIGYLNAVGSSLSLVILFIFLFMVPQLVKSIVPDENVQNQQVAESIFWAIITVGIILSIMSLIFASLLLNGIYNRRPGHVLSYFIFGVVCNAMSALMVLVLMTQSSSALTGVIHIVVHSLLLWVVWLAYKKIKMEKQGVLYTNDMSGIANPMPPSYPYAVTMKDTNTNF